MNLIFTSISLLNTPLHQFLPIYHTHIIHTILFKMWTQRIILLLFGLLFLSTQGLSQSCPVADGYFADPGQCDAYIACRDGVAERQLCPDGLLFNDQRTEYPRYPCSYPQEVSCGQRSRTQPPQGTADCPRAYGLYRTGDAANCQSYINCVGGVPSINQCPEGLAFNEETARCDWPDQVKSCDSTAFLHFQCPGVRVEADLGHPRYSDPSDCRKFYVCVENTKPRAHSCGIGFVFNPDLGVCDEPSNVPQCSNYYPTDVLDALKRLRTFDNRI